eukprot:scaffold195866_cov33-Tisochrysis_lutea.AAC.1
MDLAQIISGDAAELVVNEAHWIAGDGHVADDNARGVRHSYGDERVQPSRHVVGHLVVGP